ncbi:rhodanese homology domain-containing protein (plasmid) [Pseudomonas luteola]|uniref:rhodanese homology domain-containing protein n=1 Tax=Pseudomonas luteola TaxID=47886 RepID=UPI003DA1BB7A
MNALNKPSPLSALTWQTRTPADIRTALLRRDEVALLDVRDEALFAKAHPLFAANIPLSRLELEISSRVPRLSTPITVYDGGEGLAEKAAYRLIALGYQDVALLQDGLEGWKVAGLELFQDVNAPSKAFGEWVEHYRRTPSLSAQDVKALLDAQADVVVMDARRFDEYQTMSIPGGISVPGGELALRARALAPDPNTQIIVNCAGRTRSLIGAQSLIDAGLPNPIAALRNGTIGWTLAGLHLEHGQSRRFGEVDAATRERSAQAARALADRTGVRRATLHNLKQWVEDTARTTYRFDVRTPDEYARGHLPGFRSTPGGQLIQETDHVASVRGARIVLADDDGTRANMAAAWLKQMGWDSYVLDGTTSEHYNEIGPWNANLPPAPAAAHVSATALAEWLKNDDTQLLDLTSYSNYVSQHIPSAYWVIRALLPEALESLPAAKRYVLTCGSSLLARYAVPELEALSGKPVYLLEGGTAAWKAQGLPMETGDRGAVSPAIDRYRRPYEGTDNPHEAMQAYLEWEYGLVEQLRRDGTHFFKVL